MHQARVSIFAPADNTGDTHRLDVFEDEPLAADSPLRGLGSKALLSPHMISSNVGGGLAPGIRWATRSVLSALRGQVPDNVFNTDVVPRWQARFGGKLKAA